MDRPGHELATFFIGTEVEHTPAYGKKTLFVVGLQDYHRILEIILDSKSHPVPIEHVYFGANMSFPNLAVNNGAEWAKWEKMIFNVMEQAAIMCTLDVNVNCVEGLVESGLPENHNFIPMISVKVPYAQLLGYNATIKLDDRDFRATNPGVWCHSLHNLMSRDTFTPWDDYIKDQLL